MAGPQLAAEVAGHDHYGVAEIDCAPLAVRKPPIVQQLKQGIENLDEPSISSNSTTL